MVLRFPVMLMADVEAIDYSRDDAALRPGVTSSGRIRISGAAEARGRSYLRAIVVPRWPW
jgi:ribosomal protein S18